MISAGLGTQVIGSIIRPASYCGCFGFKPTVGALNRGGSYDGLSQSCTGVLAATLDDAWQVAVRDRAARRRRSGLSGPRRPGERCRSPEKPRALALIETAGWAAASAGRARRARRTRWRGSRRPASRSLSRARSRAARGVEKAHRARRERSRCAICAWEGRWPLNTYRARDASRLSRVMLDRLAAGRGDDARPAIAAVWSSAHECPRASTTASPANVDACVTPVGARAGAGRPELDRRSDLHGPDLAARRAGDLAAGAAGRRPAARPAGDRVRDRDADVMAVAAWIAALLAPPQA